MRSLPGVAHRMTGSAPTSEARTAALATRPMSAARKWCIVALLALGVVVANVDRLNLSIVLALPEFQKAFHITDMDRGLLNSAFFWMYALLQVPARSEEHTS